MIRLVDVNGSTAAYYEYDPYGNAIKASGSHATINPLRYRGYVYDTESGLYYLQSRYYDPKIGRFINADAFVSTGQGILGNNMFAYCLNTPTNYLDPSGTIALIDDTIILSVAVVAIFAIAVLAVPPLPVVEAVATELNKLVVATQETVSYVGNILFAKTKGKERIKDTGLEQESDEEISRKAHDNKLPSKERQRYKKEEKARGIRNRDKRMELYN